MDQVIAFLVFLGMNFGALWLIPGFLIGRWYAETFRAQHDMQRVWKGRKNYREDD